MTGWNSLSIEDTAGGDEGVGEWRQQIQSVTSQYERVLMLGDSMGGTGALLFADLATSIQVFTPQVGFTLRWSHVTVQLPLREYPLGRYWN